MSFLDLLRLAAGTFRGNRRRTLLSLLGVAIGVSSVLLLTSLGEGARRYMENQFASLGSDMLTVFPGRVETTGGIPGMGGAPNDLTIEDARALSLRLSGVRSVAPVVLANDTVAYRQRTRQAAVVGATAELREVRDLEVRRGRFLSEGPWDRGGTEVVLGVELARQLFPFDDPLGKVLRVAGWRMRVVGILSASGMHIGLDLGESAFVPVATAMRMFDRSSLAQVLLQHRPGADPDALVTQIENLVTERHGELDVTVVTQDAVVAGLGSILSMLTLVLAGIAAISLSVAGIGIMNVMLVSVSERTSEIGLLKALGAAPGQILSLFVAEAALLSGIGGLIGLALGWGGVVLLVRAMPAFPASPPAWAVVAAMVTSLLVGVVFGLVPARKAMRLDPVVALGKR